MRFLAIRVFTTNILIITLETYLLTDYTVLFKCVFQSHNVFCDSNNRKINEKQLYFRKT